MKLDQHTIAQLAEHLENAELKAQDVLKITDDHPDMDWADAYAIQDAIRARKESRGQKNGGIKAEDVVKTTDAPRDMDGADAYAIQDAIRARKESRGQKTVGLKCGLTSYAKMKQMGVDTPVFGF